MNRVLLILLLAVNTCTGQLYHNDMCDSVVYGMYKMNIDSFASSKVWHARGWVDVKYRYDASKILHIDLKNKTVTLRSEKGIVLATGGWNNYWCLSPLQLFYTGMWKVYYPNGKLKREGAWYWNKRGNNIPQQTGKWIWYTPTGAISEQRDFGDVEHTTSDALPGWVLYSPQNPAATDSFKNLQPGQVVDTTFVIDPITGQEYKYIKKVMK